MILEAFIWIFLLLPSLVILRLWRSASYNGSRKAALVVLSGSYLWLLSALLVPISIGANYSTYRVSIPYANAVVVLLCSLYMATVSAGRYMALAAGIAVLICWLYVRVVSFAV